MIEAQSLTRHYGDFTAVKGISFSVAEGEILGILGPNGAGKTTMIRMITGFLPPSSGAVTVAGHDLATDSKKARREIGYLPENVALYPEMRVREYLAYRARLEGMRRGEAREAIDRVIDRCLLTEVEWQIIGTLSKGYRQRVGLATAILHDPGVLVLDEPTVGLDPKQIIAVRELIRELGTKRTLVLSTHILSEVEQLCDRVLIIDRGHIVAEGTPAELREQSQGSSLVAVTLKESPEGAADVFAGLDDVAAVETEPGEGETRFELEGDGGPELREAIFRAAVEKGWTLLELHEKKASLEDVFVRLTGQGNADKPAEETEADAADGEPESETDEEVIS